jgi:hypothetical protein
VTITRELASELRRELTQPTAKYSLAETEEMRAALKEYDANPPPRVAESISVEHIGEGRSPSSFETGYPRGGPNEEAALQRLNRTDPASMKMLIGQPIEPSKVEADDANYAFARGWQTPANPWMRKVGPEGPYAPGSIEESDPDFPGEWREVKPSLQRKPATSSPDVLSRRVFFEPSAEEASKALQEIPEIRQLALEDDDIWDLDPRTNERLFKGVPSVEEGSPLHQRVNDALWAMMHDKDEAAGAQLIRAKDLDSVGQDVVGPLGRAWIRGPQQTVDPVGEVLLAFGRGASAGLTTNLAEHLGERHRTNDLGMPPEQARLDENARMGDAIGELPTGVALGSEVGGALMPGGVPSMLFRGASIPFRGMQGAARMAGSAASGGVTAGAEQLLRDSSVENMGGGERLDRSLAAGALGAASGGLLDPVAQLAEKGVQRMLSSNPDYIDLARAGGEIGMVGGVGLRKQLQEYERQIAGQHMIRGGKPDAAEEMAHQAGNPVLKTVKQTRESRERELLQQDEEMFRAAGNQTADLGQGFVQHLETLGKEIGSLPFASDTGGLLGQDLASKLYIVNVIPRDSNLPGVTLKQAQGILGKNHPFLENVDEAAEKVALQPRRLGPREVEGMLKELNSKLKAFYKAGEEKTSPSVTRLRSIVAEGMKLRDQFKSNYAMGQVAKKWGAKDWGDLKQQQSKRIADEEGIEVSLGLKGKLPAPEGTESAMDALARVAPQKATALRGYIRNRGKATQGAFELVESLQPEAAQLFADVLGLQAKTRLKEGVSASLTTGMSGAPHPVWGLGKAFAKPRVMAALNAVSGDVPDWDKLTNALKKTKDPKIMEYLTSNVGGGNRGFLSLGRGATSRINIDNVVELAEAAQLMVDSLQSVQDKLGNAWQNVTAPPKKEATP